VLNDVIKSLIPEDEKYYFSKRAVEGVKKAKNNMKRALAQDLQQPCLTITSHLAKVSLNSRDPVLMVDPERELYRRFTPREAARIQSFPEDFSFAGSEADAYRQVGQAIPPVVMWHLIDSILVNYWRHLFA
jgi:DNA (cytosine-5)-methyltransferase 1